MGSRCPSTILHTSTVMKAGGGRLHNGGLKINTHTQTRTLFSILQTRGLDLVWVFVVFVHIFIFTYVFFFYTYIYIYGVPPAIVTPIFDVST